MGILSNILNKIFPASHPANAQNSTAQTSAQQVSTPGSMQSASTQPTSQPSSAPPPPSAPMPQVDVEAILTAMAARSTQPLNWRSSIVDLLKLLNLDSGVDARKQLARELDYKGATNDTTTMNLWLHQQVMNRLAANGGKLPDDLRT